MGWVKNRLEGVIFKKRVEKIERARNSQNKISEKRSVRSLREGNKEKDKRKKKKKNLFRPYLYRSEIKATKSHKDIFFLIFVCN